MILFGLLGLICALAWSFLRLLYRAEKRALDAYSEIHDDYNH